MIKFCLIIIGGINMAIVKLHGTVLRKPAGFDVTWKMRNIRRGFDRMAKDVKFLGPLIHSFNMFDKAPKLSVAGGKKVYLSSHRIEKYCHTIFGSSLKLNRNSSLSIATSQRSPNLNELKETDIKIFVSRYEISMKTRNDWDPREWWIPPNKRFALSVRNPLRAIKMAVFKDATDAHRVVSFHLLLNSRAWSKKEKDMYPITGLWPVEIEGMDANWRFALTNSKHTLRIPGEKKKG